jgi:TorA maturation chaperone TorD
MRDLTNRYDQLSGGMFLFNFLGKLLQTFPENDSIDWFHSLTKEKIIEDIPYGENHPDILDGSLKMIAWLEEEFHPNPEEGITKLGFDYTRLLAGPGIPLAPPWESVYFNEKGLMFQKETMDVRNWFRRFNLEAEKLHHEPDDHIGLELAFLGYLSVLALTALERDDESELHSVLQAQKSFFVEHPIKWIPEWCEKMIKHAETAFYRGVGLLVRGGMQTLAAFHEVPIEEE